MTTALLCLRYLKCLILFGIALMSFAASEIVYVAKNGTDVSDCGHNLSYPCGTFYFASTRTKFNCVDFNSTIFIHDGQSKDEINKYLLTNKSSIYHPCLPLPYICNVTITYTFIFTIIFNSKYIHDMDDWFMRDICYDNNKTIQFKNDNLFQIDYVSTPYNGSITFNNLYVNNYNTDKIPFGIFHMDVIISIEMISVYWNECIFNNVDFGLNVPMIHFDSAAGSFHLNNCIFMDIYADTLIETRGSHIQIYNTSIINSTFNKSMIKSVSDTVDAAMLNILPTLHKNNIVLYKCRLINIETGESIITAFDLVTTISSTVFKNVSNGSIIQTRQRTFVPIQTSIVNMNNIYISTSQLITNNPNGIFNFDGHTNATINNINVVLVYDISTNCKYGYVFVDAYICEHPSSLLYNLGYVEMNGDNSFQTNITLYKNTTIPYVFNNFSCAFIVNYGVLHANNLRIENAMLGSNIFWSYGILKLHNVNVSRSDTDKQMLQSRHIIYQKSFSLFIDQCVFNGTSKHMIYIKYSQTVRITNTIFKDSKYALYAQHIDNLILDNSSFLDIEVDNRTICFDPPLLVSWSKNTSLSDNTFSYYPYCGFGIFSRGENLSLQNNIFVINYTGINNTGSLVKGRISIYKYSVSTSIINNQFINNDKGHTVWLYYFDNLASKYNCLYGNKMDGLAITLVDTNLTSCIRPQLKNCLVNSTYCKNGIYGQMNKKIDIKLKSIFIITNDSSCIWNLNDNYMALDNVQIQHKSMI
eukprot:125949_1